MSKLSFFEYKGEEMPVRFLETNQVREGVVCDVYEFIEDTSKDLAIIRVANGASTPLQKVLSGTRTIEGYLEGKGTLLVGETEQRLHAYEFPNEKINEVEVKVGQLMCWQAKENLTFYEICEPPYQDGRFQDLT